MSASFNFSQNVSSITWLPVKFETVDHKFASQDFQLTFENGIRFNFNKCLLNQKDNSFNKKTGMFLTDLKYASDILKPAQTPAVSLPLTEILTPLSLSDGLYDKIITISNSFNLELTNRPAAVGVRQISNFSTRDNFKLIFTKDNTITFEGQDSEFVTIETQDFSKTHPEIPNKFALTWTENPNNPGTYEVKFKPRIIPDSYTQKFSYLLSKNGICLFKPNSNYYYILSKGLTSNTYSLVPFIPESGAPIPASCFLKFVSHKALDLDLLKITDSHLIKYQVSKLAVQQELTPDYQLNTEYIPQNYLGIYPLESPHIEKGYAKYFIQFHGLKNYQTPEYTYSLNSEISDSHKGLHRLYEQIFTGSNQEEGLTNVYLGYKANTSEIILDSDKETYFNFPASSPRVPLSSVGLIEDGAIAGHHPYVSDRIFLRQIDYSDKNYGAPLPLNVKNTNDTWFCSWLSGSTDGSKQWMDRFYNAAYYTIDSSTNSSLSTTSLLYHDRINPAQDYVYDVPSTMYMEPGVFYKYFHCGQQNSINFLNFLDATATSVTGSKVLSVENWRNTYLEDSSGYNNNAITYGSDDTNSEVSYWNLNGSRHAVFPAKTELLLTEHFTTSLWVWSDDWSSLYGRQIFGNFYNSGYGLINDYGATAPLFTIAERESGRVFTLNYKFKITHSLDVSNFIKSVPTEKTFNNIIIVRLPDFNYWIFDTYTGIGKKYDIKNKLLATSDKVLKVTQIETDDNLNLYLFQQAKLNVVILNSDGKLIQKTYFVPEKTLRIEIFKHNSLKYGRTSFISIIPLFGNASTVDNEGNVWQVIGNNLYKSIYNKENDIHSNPAMFAIVGKTQQITCDNGNNLWIIHDVDKVSKLTPNGVFSTTRIGKRANTIYDKCDEINNRYRYINFVKTPESGELGCDSFKFKDLAVLVDTLENQVYLIESNGDLLTKLDVSLLEQIPANFKYFADGDFTGYQHLRKFYLPNKNLAWKIQISEPEGKKEETISLPIDVSLLKPGWHHFVLSYDRLNKSISHYIDSVLIQTQTISPYKYIYYKYRSPLLLGAESIKNSLLNDVIQITDAYKFIGKVSELKIYNKALSQGDVEQLYFAAPYSDSRKPIRWNMNTGSRNYVEEIKHWYQMRLPGSKSKYFNINIHNFTGSQEIKNIIENSIRKNIEKISPAYVSLYKINWL